MMDETKNKQAGVLREEILQYEQGQAYRPVDDPLSAIKTMRLEQLAACRLKSEQEMQAMRDRFGGTDDDAVES